MNEQEISDKVKTIIAGHLGISEDDVKPGSDLKNDLSADSLDEVEIVMEIEEEFDIEIPDEEADKINTVSDAVSLIQEHLKKV